MRALTPTLEASQKADKRTPYVKVEYYDADWVDLTAAVFKVRHVQEDYYAAAAIRLLNANNAYKDLNIRGKKLRVGYGYVTTSGNEWVYAPYLWVDGCGPNTREGDNTVSISAIGIWNKLASTKPYEEVTYNESGDTHHIKAIISDILTRAGFSLGTSVTEDTLVTTLYPKWTLSLDRSYAEQIVDLLSNTECELLPRDDYLCLIYPQDSDPSLYTYDTNHIIFAHSRRIAMFTPNKITVVAKVENGIIQGSYTDPETGGLAVTEEYKYTDGSKWGTDTVEKCEAKAKIFVEYFKRRGNKGYALTKINCGQELWDTITVNDRWTGHTGLVVRVGRLDVKYEKSVAQGYTLTLGFGAWSQAEGEVAERAPVYASSALPQVSGEQIAPYSIEPWLLKRYIQPFTHTVEPDKDNASYTWENVMWKAGVVNFADGTKLSLNAGSLNLTTQGYGDNPVLLYFKEGNGTIQYTNSWDAAMAPGCGVIAVVQRAGTADVKASWETSAGKSGIFNVRLMLADMIATQHLKANAVTLDKVLTRGLTLIDNGGFEAGDFTGWPSVTANNPYTIDSSLGRTGGKSLKADATIGAGAIRDLCSGYIKVNPGEYISVAYYLRRHDCDGEAGVYLEFTDENKGNPSWSTDFHSAEANDTFVEHRFSAQVPSGKFHLRVGNSLRDDATVGTYHWDDIKVSGYSMDDLADGSTYGRLLQTQIQAGLIKLTDQAVFSGGEALANNLTGQINSYASTVIQPGKISITGKSLGDLANRTLDYISDASDRKAVSAAEKADLPTVRGWIYPSKTTIDGGDIEAETVSVGALKVLPVQLLWNGDFEHGITEGWPETAGANVSWGLWTPGYEGSKYKCGALVNGSDTNNRLRLSHWFEVEPGEVLHLSCVMQTGGTFNGTCWVGFMICDGNKANATWVNVPTLGPGGSDWVTRSVTTKVGSGKKWARVLLGVNAAASTGSAAFDSIVVLRASQVVVWGTPDAQRVIIGPDPADPTKFGIYGIGTDGTTKQFYLEAATGKAMCGGGAIIMDSEGIHRNTVSTTLYDLVINQDVVNGGSASDTTNVSKGCFYTIWASFQQHTDLNARYVAELKAYDSNNALAGHARFTGVTADFASSSYPSVFLPLTFYSGPTGGSYTPYIEVVVRNYTGGTKGFWVSLWTRKIL